MKKVTGDCLNQDKFLQENPQYCIGMFPKIRSYREGVDLLADKLLDAMVHDTEDKKTSFLVGRLIPLWKRENYTRSAEQLNEIKFHEELRKDVVFAMAKELGLTILCDGSDV